MQEVCACSLRSVRLGQVRLGLTGMFCLALAFACLDIAQLLSSRRVQARRVRARRERARRVRRAAYGRMVRPALRFCALFAGGLLSGAGRLRLIYEVLVGAASTQLPGCGTAARVLLAFTACGARLASTASQCRSRTRPARAARARLGWRLSACAHTLWVRLQGQRARRVQLANTVWAPWVIRSVTCGWLAAFAVRRGWVESL